MAIEKRLLVCEVRVKKNGGFDPQLDAFREANTDSLDAHGITLYQPRPEDLAELLPALTEFRDATVASARCIAGAFSALSPRLGLDPAGGQG